MPPTKPNPVRVTNAWLKDQASVTDVCSTRISYRLTGTYPAIRLVDVGPSRRGPAEGLYRVQVECWDDDYDSARDLAGLVDAAVESGSARGAWGDVYCAGASVALGPFAQPDEKTGRFRFLLDVELWLYPAT